jgi:hypothetical protein
MITNSSASTAMAVIKVVSMFVLALPGAHDASSDARTEGKSG